MMARRQRWLGYVFHTTPGRVVPDSVNWAPVGTKRVRRLRPTWMRTMQRGTGDDWRFVKVKHRKDMKWWNFRALVSYCVVGGDDGDVQYRDSNCTSFTNI